MQQTILEDEFSLAPIAPAAGEKLLEKIDPLDSKFPKLKIATAI